MALFVAGMVVAWFVEWLLLTFWWNPKKAALKEAVATTASDVENYREERSTLKNSVLDKDRQINHLYARVAILEEATDRVARQQAAAEKVEAATVAHEREEVAAVKAVKPKEADAPPSKPAQEMSASKLPQKPEVSIPKASFSEKGEEVELQRLAKLKGVGPKLAELLVASEVDSIQKVANVKSEELEAVLLKIGGRYAHLDSSRWAEQAKLIVAGDSVGLKELQASLK